MRAGLPKREPEQLAAWEEQDVYALMLERTKDRPLFILHDGPPYANANIHMGTALNKTLKDFIVRCKSMTGFHVPFIPGWDTHGLPIESAVLKRQKADNGDADSVAAFREKCREYAETSVENQRGSFKRLGCIGDWANPYLTYDPSFEAKQIEVFGAMAMKGYIYKGLKPVYWCPHDRTALAEAE
ncbi:MAG: class I tRNA ligase family protein, partial [Oscillospiraceae bacterium]|nr:class I tRNA ligase family protein [Oscillospiraceae bacterium]